MNADREVWTVLSFYRPRLDLVRRIEPIGAGGGWSGSRLWRLEGPDGEPLCLRRWPHGHPSGQRLRFIHEVLARVVSRSLTIVPAPIATAKGDTFVEAAGHYWELTPWMPGMANFHLHPTRRRLESAMEALARFHEFAASIDPRHDQAPNLLDREAELAALRNGRLDEMEAAIARGLNVELDSRGQRVIAAARVRLANLETLVGDAVRQKLPLQPAIRDIHQEHILFTGEKVSGIIDFGALRIDTPLADIARLIGSLVGDDQEARRCALDAYAKLRPLRETDRQLIDLLDATGLVLGGLNWLKWLYLERREMGEIGRIVARLDQILARLEGPGSRLPNAEA
jgi:homoserine kinase type II